MRLKANTAELDTKAETVMAEIKELKRSLKSAKAKLAGSKADDIMSGKKNIKGVDVITAKTEGLSVSDLRAMGDTVKGKLDCGAVVISSNTDGKIMFLAMATESAVKKGVHAGNIIREVTKAAGGSGGGKPDMAQGGGKNAEKIDEALKVAETVIEAQVK